MIVCGDDALAHRLAAELHGVYRARVTVVIPGGVPLAEPTGQRLAGGPAATLFGRFTAAVGRVPLPRQPAADPVADPVADGDPDASARVVEAHALDDGVLTEAGVEHATALALVHDDDETNIHAALRARRLNPRLRLVIRLYNRKLGQHLEDLLDQAARVADPGMDPAELDAAATVLSDADTVAPALAATAIAGTSKVVQADGLLLRAAERTPPGPDEITDPGLCTLALLSSTTSDPGGSEGSDSSDDGPRLLPGDAEVAAATGRGTVVLDAVSATGSPMPPQRFGSRSLPLASLFSRRLRWSVAGMVIAVLALTIASWRLTGDGLVHAAYLTVLDVLAIDEPALDEPTARKILQLLSGLTGLLLLPVLVAAAFEALGTFRTASALRRPPRGLSGHVVLLGLGKVGTRVLARLREMDIPVVCVEEDPGARGIPLARRLGVPTVTGDVTQEGVLEAAKIQRAHALLALTSSDTTNLEATLYARSVEPRLRVGLRLYDDQFATAVYRTLRAAHPQALTRSRSVSTLAAPAFAGAMMGRQILGAIPVERRVLVFAALHVSGHPQLEGRTVAEAFTPGAWRVIALDAAEPADRQRDLAAAPPHDGDPREPGLVWDPHPGYVLRPQDRVVLAATRQGLGELLADHPSPQPDV